MGDRPLPDDVLVMSNLLSIQDAIDSLYRIAVLEGKRTSTTRLSALADYCVEQLALRGISNAETEVRLPGGGRPKNWDVAWKLHGKYRLGISLKSILHNLPGTVPNRIDDLMGEVANLQMYSPEIVIGYMIVIDVSADFHSDARGGTWCDLLHQRLSNLSNRRAPSWSVGMIESYTIIQVDFSESATLLTKEDDAHRMWDSLTHELKRRNPSMESDGDS